MARVRRCLRGWSAASSGLMTPRRTCSAGHEWSCEMSLALPLRKRYAGLSPTFTSPSSPPRMATTTIVLPIPSHAGFPFAASNTAELAALHARFRRLRSGPSSPSSASAAVNVLTAIELAVWPAAWPPIPSQTTSSESRPALLRQTTTESSFSSRSRPGSVADADFSRTPLRLYDREAECVLTDCDAVAVVQLFLLDGLAVHERAVGAAEVDDPELLASPLDAGVMSLVAGSRRIRSLSGERPTRSAASPARWLLPASGPDSMVSCACGPAPDCARRIGCVSPPVLAAGAGGGCQAGMK